MLDCQPLEERRVKSTSSHSISVVKRRTYLYIIMEDALCEVRICIMCALYTVHIESEKCCNHFVVSTRFRVGGEPPRILMSDSECRRYFPQLRFRPSAHSIRIVISIFLPLSSPVLIVEVVNYRKEKGYQESRMFAVLAYLYRADRGYCCTVTYNMYTYIHLLSTVLGV